MNRSRMALIALLLALAFLAAVGARSWRQARHDPRRVAALLDEAKGFALGGQIAKDVPMGGATVFLSTDSGFAPDANTDANVLKGLGAGCGKGFMIDLHLLPLDAPDGMPGFLRRRTAGNAHLTRIPEVLSAHPGCVALVTKMDPTGNIPPMPAGGKWPPLYVLGGGDVSLWTNLLQSGRVKAVQTDHPEGQSKGPRRQDLAAAAAQYFQVISGPAK